MTRVVFAALFVFGCGGGGSNGGDDSPEAICTNACNAEVTCGLDVPAQTCITSCEGAPSDYLVCIRAAGSDCNALASCFFAAECGGAGPTGTGSCNAAASCEGQCNISDPTTACACLCVGQMSEDHAVDLLVNNFCAALRCPQFCTAGSSFDGTQCNECFAEQCQDEAATCDAT